MSVSDGAIFGLKKEESVSVIEVLRPRGQIQSLRRNALLSVSILLQCCFVLR